MNYGCNSRSMVNPPNFLNEGNSDAKGSSPRDQAYRVREGPHRARLGSPAWDVTLVRIQTEMKRRFDILRHRFSLRGRIRPHWEVFAILVTVAEELDADWWRLRLERWDREHGHSDT